MPMDRWAAEEGTPSPLSVSWFEEEQPYNFALYFKHATGVTLLLYAGDDVVISATEYHVNFLTNKSGRIWHCRIPPSHMRSVAYYAYRVEGPFEPAEGHRFDPEKILLDPYAKAVCFPEGFDREATRESLYGVGRYVDMSYNSHSLAYFLSGASQQDDDLYVMINASGDGLRFTLQEVQVSDCRRIMDMSLPSQTDVSEAGREAQLRS